MARIKKSNGKLTVDAYPGDEKTLLAFDLTEAGAKHLAGFTIYYTHEKMHTPCYIYNNLQFEHPADHAQDAGEPAWSSLNAPLHKFRWIHVPGSAHQGRHPFMGKYTYTVTPRYFDDQQHLKPIDPALGVAVTIDVQPFSKGSLKLGFCRGFVQSQAFVRHFGNKAHIQPARRDLIFDTSAVAGQDNDGKEYSYAAEYEWLGLSAREQLFGMLNEALQQKTLRLDLFAYDLNEPDFIKAVLKLAAEGRVRVILDNAALHHDKVRSTWEDKFEDEFNRVKTGGAQIKRGKFGRYAHDKVLVLCESSGARKVLTGSTNFAVTGLYVNSNHVLVFDEPQMASLYEEVFEESWKGEVKASAFINSRYSKQPFTASSTALPSLSITFSPHEQAYADAILNDMVSRIHEEESKGATGSVMFAVMQMDNSESAVYKTLKAIHEDESIFSFGISDAPGGIILHETAKKKGVLVSGKPGKVVLPEPFNQVPGLGGGHQVHHKFVVCGFNRPDAVVYCGSSNLANGGENKNGDNLLAIFDPDVATAFAIEAIGLVDHFQFLDRCSRQGDSSAAQTTVGTKATAKASKVEAAQAAHWWLSTSDYWVKKYYDPNDLYCTDRKLFAQG
jgi:phosphatidylserine/phosphatidylglycerophosphate/cardiolipin synthase-like enzyme